MRDADPELTARLDAARVDETAPRAAGAAQEADDELAHFLSTCGCVKDEWEVEQMRAAVAATHHGFEAVIADLPEAVAEGRGERWVEGVFGLHARHQGNGVGYDSICAAGDHANTLHWIKNTGDVRDGDLCCSTPGVEVDSLFTADITRTLPVSGTFTDAQREVYDAVYAAQEAGIAAVRPGNKFSDVHAAAIRVIAEHLHAWGLLPEGVDVEDTLDKEHGQYHRRWMVHGTSHHLGIDVHDCALATREEYMDAVLEPGHGAHRRARPVLQGRRPARAGAVPRHRGAHRGRRGGHRGRLREPVGRDAAHVGRRRGLDRPGLWNRVLPPEVARLSCPAGHHGRQAPCVSGLAGGCVLRLLGSGLARHERPAPRPAPPPRVHLREHLARPLGVTCAPRAPRTGSRRPG